MQHRLMQHRLMQHRLMQHRLMQVFYRRLQWKNWVQLMCYSVRQ